MLDRRRFTFGSLVALVSGTAAASTDASQAPPEVEPEVPAPPGPVLASSWAVERDKGSRQILATLTVRNDGPEPVELMVARGRNPGARVTAEVDGEPLPPVFAVDRRELMSRVGPLPRYQVLAVGEAVEIGPYRFELPPGVEAVTMQAEVVHTTGVVFLAPVAVPLGRARS
jgi:hypothetical protein